MSKYRKKMPLSRDRAYFKNTANKTHVKNLITGMRGGKRI